MLNPKQISEEEFIKIVDRDNLAFAQASAISDSGFPSKKEIVHAHRVLDSMPRSQPYQPDVKPYSSCAHH